MRSGRDRGRRLPVRSCLHSDTSGLNSSNKRREGKMVPRRERRWGEIPKHFGATPAISKPQPVHGAAHSVVVRQLLDGTWRREARRTNQEKAKPLKKAEKQSTETKARTDSRHGRTLIVNVFGADVAQRLRSYSLKTDRRGRPVSATAGESDILANSLGKKRNARRCERSTLPEEYADRSSARAGRCHRRSVLFLEKKKI